MYLRSLYAMEHCGDASEAARDRPVRGSDLPLRFPAKS